MQLSICTLTVGEMGAGKSYCRGPVFAEEYFEGGGKRLVTTIPLNIGRFIDYYNKRHPRAPIDESRILYVDAAKWRDPDHETLDKLKPDQRKHLPPLPGPWDILQDGDHLQIDECHDFVPKSGFVVRRRAWKSWLRELRHEGCTIEFLTQNVEAMDEDIRRVCGRRIRLIGMGERREYLTGFLWDDIFQLTAKARGKYTKIVEVVHMIPGAQRWEVSGNPVKIPLNPDRFHLYDSFNASSRGAQGRQKLPWEVLSWPSLILWCFRRNLVHVSWRIAALMLFVWLVPMGGAKDLMLGFTSAMQAVIVGPKDDGKGSDQEQGAAAVEPPKPEKPNEDGKRRPEVAEDSGRKKNPVRSNDVAIQVKRATRIVGGHAFLGGGTLVAVKREAGSVFYSDGNGVLYTVLHHVVQGDEVSRQTTKARAESGLRERSEARTRSDAGKRSSNESRPESRQRSTSSGNRADTERVRATSSPLTGNSPDDGKAVIDAIAAYAIRSPELLQGGKPEQK